MALIDRVQRYQSFGKATPAYPDWALATAERERHNLPDLALPAAQANLYQKLGWVNAAVNAVARAVALEALNVYRLQGEQREDVDNHPFEVLLRRPNPLMSRYELLFATVAWRKLTGNAYWWLSRGRDNVPPDEVWVLPSRRIEPVPDGRMYLKGYVYDPGDGTKLPLEPWEVVHFRGFHPANDFVGASDIESFSWTAQGDHAMAQWNARFFDQDNAKFPGVLAFADPIPDSAWELMKREFNEAHGGARRHMRMMRNVGAGGVQWIQTSMAQKDMEFLRGREFNRDEIFAILAPGLSSVLAVNATEANATAGKSTLMEHAVWPEMVAIAEKVTNDVLPAYGPNLVAEFDDPRVMDRALELEERKVWQQVHTVDEVREHYDGDDPVGDERGALLVPQVDKLAGKPEVAQDAPLQLTAGGGGPVTAAAEEAQVEEQAPAVPDIKARRAEELAKLRRWARKRKEPRPEDFVSDVLTLTEIRAALKADPDEEDEEAPKTPYAYILAIWALLRQASTGAITFAVASGRIQAISAAAIMVAYARGVGKAEDELSGADWQVIDAQVRASQAAAVALVAAVEAGKYEASTGALEAGVYDEAGGALESRLKLWGRTIDGAYTEGQVHQPDDPLMIWLYDPAKEHCSDCARFDGQVMRASEWRDTALYPQSALLECGGWNCGCRLIEV